VPIRGRARICFGKFEALACISYKHLDLFALDTGSLIIDMTRKKRSKTGDGQLGRGLSVTAQVGLFGLVTWSRRGCGHGRRLG
jgi:hypothetical protein